MIKIKYFSIENFKAFNGLKHFEFNPITFLVGKNSSGKSSLLEGIKHINEKKNEGAFNLKSINRKNNYNSQTNYSIYQEIFNVEELRSVLANVVYISHRNDEDYYYNNTLLNNEKLSQEDFNKKVELVKNEMVTMKTKRIVDAFKDIKLFYELLKTNENKYLEFYNNLENSYENDSSDELEIYEIDYFKIKPKKIFFNNENFFSTPLKRMEDTYIDFIIINSFKDLFEKHKNIFKKYDQAYFQGIPMKQIEVMSISEINKELDLEMNNRIEMLKQINISDLQKDFNNENDKIKFELITKRNAEAILQLTLDKLFDEYNSMKIASSIFKLKDDRIEFIKNCLILFKLGIDIEIEAQTFSSKPNQRFYNIFIYDIEGNKKELGNDFGFGIFTLVSIIISVSINRNSVFLIEEPEAFLHPNLQSLLADFFVNANQKFGIQFLIETHSEYLIRRMQFLIANSKFNKDKNLPIVRNDLSKIYYFNNPNEITNQNDHVYPINFNEDGSLDGNFGNGFFDEASNSAFDLYTLLNNLN